MLTSLVMWIEFHSSLRDHPKIIRGAKQLGIPKAHFIGHLGTFWLWCLSVSPDGDLLGFDHEDIETGAEWDGKPGLFVQTLIDRGLLDYFEGSYLVHDWEIYAEHLKARERKRRERARKKEAKSQVSRDVTGHERISCHVTQTRTDQTRTDQTRPDIYKIQKSVPKDNSDCVENSFIDWVHARDVFSTVRKRYGHGSYKPTGYGKYTDKLSDVASWANAESEESEWQPLQLVELSAAGFVVSANEAAKGAKYNPAFWWNDPGAHLAVGFQELLRWKIALLRGEIRELQQTGKRDHDTISEIERISGVIAGLNAEISTYGERTE